jgi:MFS family permease
VAAGFVVALGYGIVAPALPVLARSFDVGVIAASVVVSGFAVVRIAFAPVSGRLLGRLGELRVFCGGLVIVALSSVACAVAGTFAQLLLFRAAGGVGSTMFTVAETALVIRLAPPGLRGRAAGACGTGFLLGIIAGPVLGGPLAVASLRASFLVYAALLAVAAVTAAGLLRDRSWAPSSSEPTVTVTFTSAVSHPTFRAALMADFLNGWTVYGVRLALVPLFVAEALHRSSTWAGVALTAFALGTGACLQLGGRWSDRSGRRAPVLAGSAIVAVTGLALGFCTSVAALVVVSLLAGAGTGLMTPSVTAAAADVIAARARDAHGGAAVAGFQMVGDAGAVVGPVVAGILVERAGYAAGFATTALIALVAFVCWLRVPETRPR